ncbi:SpoIIE family protein phosphatase [Actinacidiphila oryziradicis]|uniref:SpoIIE family protein phosphatase n=1 Tax=Actinacidiphila oryziradicis TaxID=2571141 RepID=UPI0023F147F6|nr:SpoIIE family protein phosphatase [Actinacidiphila oryziradicis]MCW2871033.1 hypothetical protein [Actinacidiphila oryziradicis]
MNAAVIILDTTGRVRLWSQQAEDMLGWTGDHAVGLGFDRLMHVRGDADLLAELLDTESWTGHLSLHHRDGYPVQVRAEVSLLAVGDGRPYVLASLCVVSRQVTVWRDLATLESLFDSSPLGVAILGNDLRHIKVNKTLALLDHHPVEKHLGRTVNEVVGRRVGEALAELQRNVLRTGRPVVDVIMPGPDGEGFRSVSCSRLEDEDHRVLGVGCTLMDVSERYEVAAQKEIVRERLSLLNDVGTRVADLLDIPRIAERLADTVVPRFSDYAGVIVLEEIAAAGELPRQPPTHRTPLVQLGAAYKQHSPPVERLLRAGQSFTVSERSVTGTALHTGLPQLANTPERLLAATYPGDPGTRAALELGIHSMMVLPLRVGGIVLGLLVVYRAEGSAPFNDDDMAFAMKLAGRASTSLDNARLYARERAGALMLQRALLPHHIPEPPGVRIAFRYVPGSTGTEAGGDWFDVTQLTGGRVALVIGDVTGHGLRAAATMGLLRTAVRTLSGLDLPPAELLQRIDDIAVELAHDPDEALMATCVYAVYDASLSRCTIARAGHVPPLIVEPDPASEGGRRVRLLELPPGVPLGVGGVKFEAVEFDVPDESVLVLYTDGLIETRGEDISEGLDRLRARLAQPYDSLEATCDGVLGILEPGTERDDVALLLAQLSGLPGGLAADGAAR